MTLLAQCLCFFLIAKNVKIKPFITELSIYKCVCNVTVILLKVFSCQNLTVDVVGSERLLEKDLEKK
jgi:hypothetical protein